MLPSSSVAALMKLPRTRPEFIAPRRCPGTSSKIRSGSSLGGCGVAVGVGVGVAHGEEGLGGEGLKVKMLDIGGAEV